MIPRREPSPALLRLAVLQSNVLTREQALAHGLGADPWHRLLTTGVWRSITSGIALTRPTDPDWSSLAWAGVLAGGDRSRLGGTAAGFASGLVDQEPAVIRVLVPMSNARSRPGPWHFVRERPGVRSERSPGSPPRTTVEDTVLDLVGDSEIGDLPDLLTRVVQRGLTTPARLGSAARHRSRLRHRRLIELILADVAAGAESPLELSYLRDVERAHGLPTGRRQAARLRYCTDVSYDDYAVLVELDGRLGHDGLGRFRDMWRDNQFLVSGRLTLRYGWRDVVGACCEVAHQVGRLLVRQGWSGVVQRCPRCRSATDTDLAA